MPKLVGRIGSNRDPGRRRIAEVVEHQRKDDRHGMGAALVLAFFVVILAALIAVGAALIRGLLQ